MMKIVALPLSKFGPWALVTGASSGLGVEFARQLAANGFQLVLVSRNQPALNRLGESLRADFGIEYRVVTADLADPSSISNLIRETEDLEIGLLISNAGAGRPGEFAASSEMDLARSTQLNAISHRQLAWHFGGLMSTRSRGGLLFVSAVGAAQGLPYMANDGASKAYVLSLGRALNTEFKEKGIHVSVLEPSFVSTPAIAKLGLDPSTLPLKPIKPETCVREGLTALKKNRASHLSGRLFRFLFSLLPPGLITRMNGIMLRKSARNLDRDNGRERTVS